MEAAQLLVSVRASGVEATAAQLGKVERAGRSADTVMKGMSRSFVRLGAVVGAAGFAGVTAKAVSTVVGFDRSMRNVNSIAQLSEGSFQKLNRSVLDLAGPSAQAPKTLADGLYQLVSSGFDSAESLVILKSSARAATAGLTDTATATTAVAGVLNAYNLKAKDAARVSDDLFQTVNLGVLSFQDLAQGIGPVLPVAAQLGVGLKQVGALTATLTKAGIPAAEAFTYQKGAMVALIKPTEALQGQLKKLGVASGGQLIQKTGSLQASLQALYESVGGNTEAFAALFPDIRGMTAAFGAVGRNASGAAKDLKGFQHDSGATATALKEQSKSISFAWNQVKANVAAAVISAASEVVPSLASATKSVAAFVGEMRTGTGSGGQFASEVGNFAHVAGAMITPVVGAAVAVGKLVGALAGGRGAFGALAGAAVGFAAFKLLPVASVLKFAGAISAAVTAARAAGSLSVGFSALAASVNPITAAGVAAVGLGAAIGILIGRQRDEASTAQQAAAAHREQAAAIQSVQNAERAAADKGFAAKQSTLELKDATRALTDLRKKGVTSGSEYEHALLRQQRASFDAAAAHRAYASALNKTERAVSRSAVTAGDRLRSTVEQNSALRTEQSRLEGLARSESAAAAAGETTASVRDKLNSLNPKVAESTKALAQAVRDYNQAAGASAVSELNLHRLMSGGTQIVGKNARAVANLVGIINLLPKKKQTRFELADQGVLARLGSIIGALGKIVPRKTIQAVVNGSESAKAALLALTAIAKGVPAKKVIRIVQNAKTAEGEIRQLQAAIDALRGKKVTVDIVTNRTTNLRENTIGKTQGGGAARPDPPRTPGQTHDAASFGLKDIIASVSRAQSPDERDAGADKRARARIDAINATLDKKRKEALGKAERRRLTDEKSRLTRGIAARKRERLARHRDEQQNPQSLVNIDRAQLRVVQADDGSDDLLTGAERSALEGIQAARKKRMDAIRKALKRKQTRGHRRDLLGELSTLTGESADTQRTLTAVATPDALAPLVADVVKAQVGGGDVRGALAAELNAATSLFDQAVAAGDNTKITDLGQTILSLRESIKSLDDTVQDSTQATQAQIDIQRQILDRQASTIQTQGAELRALGKYVKGVVSREVGQRNGRGSGVPVPLASAAY